MGEVRGPVEWIDDPPVRGAALLYRSSFFRQETVVGKGGSNAVDDALFGGMVCVRYEVDRFFMVNAKACPSMFEKRCPRLAAGGDGEFQ